MAILEIENLNVTYLTGDSHVRAVRNLCLSVHAEESLGIVGESGSGKSTLAMAVLRLLNPKTTEVSGTVLFKGRDLLGMGNEELASIRWKELAVVFQKSINSLSPVHRIGAQLTDIYRVHEPRATKEACKDRILGLFSAMNLPPRVFSSYPHELSGGMMQRVSIALSLLHNPDLLILDEATTALDVITQGQILDTIKDLESRLKIARIMVSHDISVIAATCKKVAVMYAGSLLETGEVKDVLVEPLHPYTQGLLRSFPSLRGEKQNVRGIPGSTPDLSALPDGCAFAPRCALARDVCRRVHPSPVSLPGGRKVACHLLEEVESVGG